MDIITKLTFNHLDVLFSVKVVCFNESVTFLDDWEMTDTHQGGVTVQNPEHDRNSYKFAIPLNTSIAEQVERFRAEGANNPSSAAYVHLQNCLRRDINANDYGLMVDASIGDIEILDNEHVGSSFTYSYWDTGSLEELANEMLEECKEEIIEAAIKGAHDAINSFDDVTNFIKESAIHNAAAGV